jgi:DNA-binding LacI/PurR family transcriptional regulator
VNGPRSSVRIEQRTSNPPVARSNRAGGASDSAASPDALFCFNDILAHGATRALHERGVRIPDDIAVAGWDDIDESRYSTPTLTSISPSKTEIARLAVAELTAGSAGNGTERRREITPPFTLEVRESTVGPNREASDPAAARTGGRRGRSSRGLSGPRRR